MHSNSIQWYPGMTMAQVERQVIELALTANSQDRKMTAQSLGISERKVYARLAQYKFDDWAYRKAQHDKQEELKHQLSLDRGEKNPYEAQPFVEPVPVEELQELAEKGQDAEPEQPSTPSKRVATVGGR